MFIEEFEKLTKADQTIFRKAIKSLLYTCFVVRRVYSKSSHMNVINSNYLFIERHFNLFVDYLSYMGIDLSKDDENGVIFVSSSDESNKIQLDGVTTLIIYALRSYYEEKLSQNPTANEIYMDSVTIKSLLKELGLTSVTKRISSLSIAQSLRKLAFYNIVVLANKSFSESSYAFYILPSIRYVISNAKLNALYNSIENIRKEKEEKFEDTENTIFDASENDIGEE
ncbi:MAG: DUF4194 domain-containing protein [Bacilli bacterium]